MIKNYKLLTPTALLFLTLPSVSCCVNVSNIDYENNLRNNGINGKEATVNGRISLAHEDSIGHCNSTLCFLASKNSNTMSK